MTELKKEAKEGKKTNLEIKEMGIGVKGEGRAMAHRGGTA